LPAIATGESSLSPLVLPFSSLGESSEVSVEVSLAMMLEFFAICLAVVVWIFKTGYRLKS
jgi:hypothetical protein